MRLGRSCQWRRRRERSDEPLTAEYATHNETGSALPTDNQQLRDQLADRIEGRGFS